MESFKQIRIAIIEDEKELREGLQALINFTPNFSCASSFANMEDALRAISADEIDLVPVRGTGGGLVNWFILNQKFNQLRFDNLVAQGSPERQIKDIPVTTNQRVILKLEVKGQLASYKMKIEGTAVNLASGDERGSGRGTGIGTGRGDGGSSKRNEPEQICLPRCGSLILTAKDGKKMQIDLSNVQKIEIQ